MKGNRARAVVLVDDDEAVLRALERTLRDLPISIVTARSGEQALAWLSDGGSPLAVISDLQMTGISGLELLREVARRVPHAHCALHTGESKLEVTLGAGSVLTIFAKPALPELLRRFVLARAEYALNSLTVTGDQLPLTEERSNARGDR